MNNNYDAFMMQEWICKSEDETAETAQEIAGLLSYPTVICLYGDLGAGKTSFSRAMIRHMLNDADMVVPSPTYTLVQTYDDEQIWHFDLYRMEDPDQVYDIGWEEAILSKLCLIEWPERLGHLKPQKTVDIRIETLQDGARRIILDA